MSLEFQIEKISISKIYRYAGINKRFILYLIFSIIFFLLAIMLNRILPLLACSLLLAFIVKQLNMINSFK